MNRQVIGSGVAAFVMAFLGTVFGLWVAGPAIVDAQASRLAGERLAIAANDGTERVRADTGPRDRGGA